MTDTPEPRGYITPDDQLEGAGFKHPEPRRTWPEGTSPTPIELAQWIRNATEDQLPAVCKRLETLLAAARNGAACIEQDHAGAERRALSEAADAWRHEGRRVMFNHAGDDLTPQGRVGKWLRDRATRRGMPDTGGTRE